MTKILADNDPLGQRLLIGNHVFPGVWRYMMPPEFLKMDFPAEKRATCMNCPKAAFDEFRPDYRCCTYHPRIPNFLLGFAVETDDGQNSVRRLLDLGVLTPEGTNQSPAQWIDYLGDLQFELFGKSQNVLCPLLDQATGYCTVHAFRNSVCSTFFCHKDHGSRGETFWDQIQVLGSQIEMSLSQWALEQAGFNLTAYVKRYDGLADRVKSISNPESGGWSKEALKVLWGDWYGNEWELYRKCATSISENRDVLWNIANEFEIQEAEHFDRALIRSVPKQFEEQIDPTDLEPGEPVLPEELWDGCRKAYQKLWHIAKHPFMLSGRVRIKPNPKDDRESIALSEKPYVVEYLTRKGGSVVEWREFVDESHAKALAAFSAPQIVDWQLLSSPMYRSLGEPRKILSEWVGKQLLIKS